MSIRKRHKTECAYRTTRTADSPKRCNCNGSWQARIPDPARPGGTAKIERTFTTRREAEAWQVQQRSAVITGDYIDTRKAQRPFSAVVEAWKESWPTRLSPTTERRYLSALDTYLIPEFGSRPVGAITHEAVQRFINRLAAETRPDKSDPTKTVAARAPGTVRNVYATLRTALATGVRLGVIRTNPCANVQLPRARREEMLFLTADEVRAVAETIDRQYRVLVYLAAWTGLRAGELAGLQRRDVDLLRNLVHVRRAVKDVNGHLSYGPTKTHAHRTVSLPAFLATMLRVHLEKRPNPTDPAAPVFTMKSGGLLRMGLVHSRYFRRAAEEALPADKRTIRWHDLRHTAVALAISAGAHPKHVQERMGHSSITVTLDRYGHLMPGAEASLAAALDAAFKTQRGLDNVAELRVAGA
jgi:integrase